MNDLVNGQRQEIPKTVLPKAPKPSQEEELTIVLKPALFEKYKYNRPYYSEEE